MFNRTIPNHKIHRTKGKLPMPRRIAFCSEEEKEKQREAGAALLARLKALCGTKNTELTIEPGVYRLSESFLLSDAENVTVKGAMREDGYPAVELIFEKFVTAGYFLRCRSCRISAIAVDYDPVPWFQGRVEEYDPENERFVISVDEAYRDFFRTWHTPDMDMNRPNRIWLFPRRADETMVMGANIYGFVNHCVEVGENRYRLSFTEIDGKPFLSSVKMALHVGDRYAFPLHMGGSGAIVEECEDTVFEDYVIYASGAFSVAELRGEGGNVYRRMRLCRRPETDRLIVSVSDGFHSISARRGPTLEDCELSYTTDDLFNAHNFLGAVMGVEEDGSVLLSFPCTQQLEPESEIDLFDYVTLARKGRTHLHNLEKLTDEAVLNEGRTMRQRLMETYGAENFRSFDSATVYRAKLDEGVDAKAMDGISAFDYAQNGVNIRRCYFHDGMVRPILIRGNHATIEDNIIVGGGWSAVLVETCFFWLEGPMAESVVIRNNLFDSVNRSAEGLIYHGAVCISPRMWDGGAPSHAHGVFRDFTVEGNLFRRLYGGALTVRNTSGIRFCDNVIESMAKDRNPAILAATARKRCHHTLIDFQCCDGITLSGNTVSAQPTENCPDRLSISENPLSTAL